MLCVLNEDLQIKAWRDAIGGIPAEVEALKLDCHTCMHGIQITSLRHMISGYGLNYKTDCTSYHAVSHSLARALVLERGFEVLVML